MSSRYRQSTGAPTPSRGMPSASQRMGELPPYEPLGFALNTKYRDQVNKLADPRNFRPLTARFDEIISCLGDVAAEVNEAVNNKEKALKKEKQRLAAAEGDGSAQERIEKMERELEEMRQSVDKTTQQLDKDVRKMIDAEASMTDLQSTLNDLATEQAAASTQPTQTQRSQRRRNRDDDDDDEEYPDFDPTDPTNATQSTQSTQRLVAPSAAFRDRLQRARDRYQSRSMVDRYSHNNEYRNFKKVVNEAIYDGEKDLPAEHLWFTVDSTAAPGITDQAQDSDDDLQISKAIISTKCPLTLLEFRDPVTSKKCPHSFERDAIMSIIDSPGNVMRVGGSAQRGARDGMKAVECPVPGCQKTLTTTDLHSDPVLKRKIARIQRANKAAEDSDDDVEGGAHRPQSIGSDDDEDIDAMAVAPAMRFKSERRSGVTPAPSQRVRGQPTVLELQDDDDGDDEDMDE